MVSGYNIFIISLWLEQELRIKNWKVMEALSAAELRAKSNNGKNFDVSPHFIYFGLPFRNFFLFVAIFDCWMESIGSKND